MNNSDDLYESGKEQIDKIQNKVKESAKKKVKKGSKAISKKIGKAIVFALKKFIALIAPFIGVILIIAMICSLSYYFLFEVRGSEQQYSLQAQYENENEKGDKGYEITKSHSKENREIQTFYKYFSARSYYKLLENDKKLISWDIKGENIEDNEEKFKKIHDFYDKENQFYLNQDLLYSLDEIMGQKEAKTIMRYPEQFIQPVHYDSDKLTLKSLVDDKGNVVSKSNEYDKDGKKTGDKVTGMWDYGIASVLHYLEKEQKRTVEGTYIKEDYWDEKSKSVKTKDINEPYAYAMEGYPKKIYLIDKAVSFGGEFKFKYKITKEKQSNLTDSVSSNPKDPVTKIQIGEVEGHKLYKYRTGFIYEEIPRDDGVEVEKAGDKYLRDYLYNYDIYTPSSVMRGFDFKKRTGSDLEDIEDKYSNIDYSGVDVGGSATEGNDAFANAKRFFPLIQKWAEHFGVDDPWINLAQIAQESAGNPNINADGLMQVVHAPGTRMCAMTKSGQEDCIVLTAENKLNPDTNIKAGMIEFANKLKYYNGDYLKTIQGYNFDVSYIEKTHPESWSSQDWMKYIEETRYHYGMQELGCATRSADDSSSSLPIYGDAHYIQHVMQYYAGKGDFKTVIPGAGSNVTSNGGDGDGFFSNIWNKFKKEFLKVFHEDYMEDEPRKRYKNFAKKSEVDAILKMTISFNQKILFSENSGLTDSEFWDKNFSLMWMTNSGNKGKGEGEGMGNYPGYRPEMAGFVPPLAISNPIITSPFGPRQQPIAGATSFHNGVDIGVPEGTPVYSIGNGKVVIANRDENADGCGKYIKIRHENNTESLYCHLSDVQVNQGDNVKKSQKIGLTGNTGASTGPHLHFGFYINGTAVDGMAIVMNQTAFAGNLSGKGGEIAKYALSFQGVPYVWGGTTPDGFDCSGLMQYVYNHFGINIPRTSECQQGENFGRNVKVSELQPGDLVFFGVPAGHVGMYIGNGKYVHAPDIGEVVKISNVVDRIGEIDPNKGCKRVIP